MAKSKKAGRLEELAARARGCTLCPLWESRTLAVPGDGKLTAKVMIIGEAPGREEDETGKPFVGATGRFLGSVLEGTGLDRADFFITNTVKCRPPRIPCNPECRQSPCARANEPVADARCMRSARRDARPTDLVARVAANFFAR